MAYLEIGRSGGHVKRVCGTEVRKLGPDGEVLLGFWGFAPEVEKFLKFKLNPVHVIQ